MKETLRLYPPMAVGKREAGGEMVVNGYGVPAGVSYISFCFKKNKPIKNNNALIALPTD